MRTRIEKDRVLVYPPIGGLFLINAFLFVVLFVLTDLSGFAFFWIPVAMTFVAFLLSLWEVVHPLVFDKDGVEGYFSMFSKKRYSWDEVSEVVLCHAVMGKAVLPAVGIQCGSKNKKYGFVYYAADTSTESVTRFQDLFLISIENLSGGKTVRDCRDVCLSDYSTGSDALNISIIIYISMVILLSIAKYFLI